jgi:spore cortex biosynthesis protein YabQ
MTLSAQFLTMLSMIGMGALFGTMLDTYQRFLQRSKRKHWLVFLNDLLFWTIQALLIFYTLFLINKGEIRFYIFIALLCGFAAYQSLFKGLYLRILELMINSFISFYSFLRKMTSILVFKPVRGLIQLGIFIIVFIGRGLITLVKFIFKVILVIVKFILRWVGKILLIFWKLMPKRIKKTVEKLYNRTAGIFKPIKNYFYKLLDKWKTRNK